MNLQCPKCKLTREASRNEHKLLRTVVTGGKEWILVTCRNCLESWAIHPQHAFYADLSKLSNVTHISPPKDRAS